MIKDIVGNERTKELLLSIIKKDKIGTAYIFWGEENVGKNFSVLQFVKALNCLENKDDGDCCDKCENCIKIEKTLSEIKNNYNAESTHPDILYIDTDKTKLSIELLRGNLKKANSLKPVFLKKKIVIVNDAERMTEEAANSVLKELEEPNLNVVIILIVNNIEAILPTIRSRCFDINIKRASILQIKEKLKQLKPELDEEILNELANYSEGKIGLALNYEEIKENHKEAIEIFKVFNNLEKEDIIGTIFEKINDLETKMRKQKDEKDSIASRSYLSEILKILALIYKDLMLYLLGINNCFEEKYSLKINEKKFNIDKIIKILFLIKEADKELDLNANINILLNSLFFNIKKVVQEK